MNDDYVDAIIYIKVPKWQIGQNVTVHFPDSMCKSGICESVFDAFPLSDGHVIFTKKEVENGQPNSSTDRSDS